MPQVKADAGYNALLQWILIDRYAALSEMSGRVDMGAGMIRHRDEHRCEPVHVAGFGERLLVVLPGSVDRGRVAGIAGGALIEFSTKIDNLHDWYPFG